MTDECLIVVDIRPAGDGPFGNTTNTVPLPDCFVVRCALVDASFAWVMQEYGDLMCRLARGA